MFPNVVSAARSVRPEHDQQDHRDGHDHDAAAPQNQVLS
jgi:hypothetical protein